MNGQRSGRRSYLMYGLLAIVLIGGYLLVNGTKTDNSATMAPNLTLGR